MNQPEPQANEPEELTEEQKAERMQRRLARFMRPKRIVPNKYTPHQGEAEKARRRRQIAKGMIRVDR